MTCPGRGKWHGSRPTSPRKCGECQPGPWSAPPPPAPWLRMMATAWTSPVEEITVRNATTRGFTEPARKIIACPFCNNAEEGCCYCDHTGRVYEDTLPEVEPDDDGMPS